MAQFDPLPEAFPAAGEPGPAPADTAPGPPADPAPGPAGASVPPAPTTGRISLLRALGELGAVYAASFGLGIVSAIVLLKNPNFDSGDNVINNLQSALIEIFNYIMQAAVVIFGVGYFSLRRGLSLRALFGRVKRPAAYSADPYGAGWPTPGGPAGAHPAPQGYGQPAGYGAAPGYGAGPGYGSPTTYPATAGYPAANGYPAQTGYGAPVGYGPPGGYGELGYAVPAPIERGPGWQFARTFFVAMGGFVSFLIVAIAYISISGRTQGAPSQGSSLWLIPVGVFVSAAAGFGEEMLITGMTVTVLEQAGFARRPWVIYAVAICLRIPFHLYYGWAALGVICFTATNIWAYRRWRLLWPIVLAHAAYDFVESVAQTMSNAAGVLLILALAFTTLTMVIIIACIEGSDSGARRRFQAFAEYQGGAAAGFGRPAAAQPLDLLHPVAPQTVPPVQPGQTAQMTTAEDFAAGLAPPRLPPGPIVPAGFGQPMQPPPMPQPPSLLVPDPVLQQPISSTMAQPPEVPEPPQFPTF
ncbi:MAG TPA: CPBP family intramembrane glutamic endopeptidase [Actinocrinis sp.]|nr:CPBP family intramembrane glutamic endopeptidase [Actinocrinis sp.]